MTIAAISQEVVTVRRPEDANVIVGQVHSIETVDDLNEALFGVRAHLRFGIGFCEASGACLVRVSGNDDELVQAAAQPGPLVSAQSRKLGQSVLLPTVGQSHFSVAAWSGTAR
jgi:uncharacterized protein